MSMRKILKHFASFILVPVTRWYLRKKRKYIHEGIIISVHPQVFHPGLFSSTRFLLEYLKDKMLANQSLLEVGSGTGLISVMAAKAHARVTALDLSRAAVENTTVNARSNNTEIR